MSFNFITAVIIFSDFGAQENKVSHCFHCFPIYLPWSVGARDWNANVGSQETSGVTGIFGLWSTEWSRAKANRLFPRERTGPSKHPLLTTQEKTLHMNITRWPTSKSDSLYSLQPKMEKLYTVSKNKTGSWLWLSLLPNSDLNWRE